MLITNYYTSRIDEPTIAKVQTTKVGSEVISQIDFFQEYAEFPQIGAGTITDIINAILDDIKEDLEFFTPEDYDVRISIKGSFQPIVGPSISLPEIVYPAGLEIRPKTFVASGERIIVRPVVYTPLGPLGRNYGYFYARYWVWQKPRYESESMPTTTSTTTTTTTLSISSYYTTAGDGYISRSDPLWGNVHDGPSGAPDYLSDVMIVGSREFIGSNNYEITRSFIPFDTSPLPDGATITSATLHIYINTMVWDDQDANAFIVVLAPTYQLDHTQLISTDYDKCGLTHSPLEGSSRVSWNSLNLGWNNIPLDSMGMSWINKVGITKLGLREGHDIIDDPIDVDLTNVMTIRSLESIGVTYDPYLEITYV